MGERKTPKNWQILELMGKGAILAAVLLQLVGTNTIQRNLTNALRAESEVHSLATYSVAWSAYLMAERNAGTLAGLEISLLRQRLMQQMVLSLVLNETVPSDLTTETSTADVTQITSSTEIHEEMLVLESRIDQSQDRNDTDRSATLLQSIKVNDVAERTSVLVDGFSSQQDTINLIFAVLFLLGSVMVLFARHREFKTE